MELRAVAVEIDGRGILDDVSATLTQRTVAVIGANGSGKSTFARLLNGLVRASAGEVRVHGLDVARETRRVRERVGFVFTNPDAQILMPTVAEDVALSLKGRGRGREEAAARVAAVLDRFGLSALADRPAYSLSGGQKQLLALASVLVTEPAVVVADEPTTLLDLGNARLIGDVLTSGIAVQTVIVTHDLELAERCDAALRFADGRLVDAGEPAEVTGRYRAAFA
ncbi:hypothetical protein AOA12_12725 [Microbacterium sp. No. 7]|nr:hypothetical protein AOA12_12725 [Microbacterium sp. No. 7]